MVTIQDSLVVQRLLDAFDAGKKLKNDGGVTFSFKFPPFAWYSMLQQNVKFDPGIKEIETKQIISNAIKGAARQGRIDLVAFQRFASQLERDYLKTPAQRFVLLSDISVLSGLKIPRMRIDDTYVSFPNSIPRSFFNSRARLAQETKKALFSNPPTNYRWVRVSSWARSEDVAARKCLDALNFRRAVWNLGLNISSGHRFTFSGQRKPVNRILLGPIHTVHSGNGGISRDVWWYEPNYYCPVTPINPAPSLTEVVKFEQYVRRRLARSAYGSYISEAILRYGQALDERDWSTSFLKIWQVLEDLTITGRNDGCKLTIRRAAFVHSDHEFHSKILENLRDLRHDYVHRGQEQGDVEVFLYMLKDYVENLFLFHLDYAGDFDSKERAGEFLDLNPRIEELERRIVLHKNALKYRK